MVRGLRPTTFESGQRRGRAGQSGKAGLVPGVIAWLTRLRRPPLLLTTSLLIVYEGFLSRAELDFSKVSHAVMGSREITELCCDLLRLRTLDVQFSVKLSPTWLSSTSL